MTLLVIGIARQSPLLELYSSGLSTRAGRIPPCSCPLRGSKSSQIMSPLFGVYVLVGAFGVREGIAYHSLPQGVEKSSVCRLSSLILPSKCESSSFLLRIILFFETFMSRGVLSLSFRFSAIAFGMRIARELPHFFTLVWRVCIFGLLRFFVMTFWLRVLSIFSFCSAILLALRHFKSINKSISKRSAFGKILARVDSRICARFADS